MSELDSFVTHKLTACGLILLMTESGSQVTAGQGS